MALFPIPPDPNDRRHRFGLAVHRFYLAQSQILAQLIDRSMADGARMAHRDHGDEETDTIPEEHRARARRRILAGRAPALLRWYQQAFSHLQQGKTPEELAAWSAARRKGLERQLAGTIWAAGEAGYASALHTRATQQGTQPLLYWHLEAGAKHCAECPDIAAASPYYGYDALPTYPGAGDTPCNDRCRCWVDDQP